MLLREGLVRFHPPMIAKFCEGFGAHALRYPFTTILSVGFLLVGALLAATLSTRYDSPLSDFIQEYEGALALRHGISPYSPRALELMKESTGVEGMKNFHPPFTAALFLPFTYLGYPAAFVLHHALLVLLHLYVLLRVTRIAGLSPRTRLFIVSASCLWFPFYLGLLYGNIALIIAAGILLAHDEALRGRDRSSGALLAVMGLLKLYPLLFLLSLTLGRRWRIAVAMTLVTGAGVACSGGLEHYFTFFGEVAPENVRRFGYSPANMSLTGILFPLFRESPWVSPFFHRPLLAGALQAGATLLTLLALASALGRRSRKPDLSLLFGLTSVAMLLVSPTIWVHNFSLALLPLALLWREARGRRERLPLLLILAALSLPGHNPLFDLALEAYAPEKAPALLYLLLRVQPWAVITLFVLTLRKLEARPPLDECEVPSKSGRAG